MARAIACELPNSSRLRDSLAQVDYLDSFEIPMARSGLTLIETYAAGLDHLPAVFKQLLVVRSMLVKPFGIAGVSYRDLTRRIDKTRSYAVGDKIGRWTIYGKYDDELITGANDKHLDFRVSVFREEGKRVVLSTAVMPHNMLGRAYLTTILPLHRFGVARLLTSAATAGRL